jgi:hypothetical protein
LQCCIIIATALYAGSYSAAVDSVTAFYGLEKLVHEPGGRRPVNYIMIKGAGHTEVLPLLMTVTGMNHPPLYASHRDQYGAAAMGDEPYRLAIEHAYRRHGYLAVPLRELYVPLAETYEGFQQEFRDKAYSGHPAESSN